MTAFARVQSGQLAWEIRSVNQRYLDLTFKVPEHIRALEPALRNLTKDRLHRGKVDCLLRIDATIDESDQARIDTQQLRHLLRLVDDIAAVAGNLAPVNPLDVLRWPGVMTEEQTNVDSQMATVEELFKVGVDALTAMREREGAELERLVLDRLDALAQIVGAVRQEAPEMNSRLATRLRDRINEVAGDVDQGRLEQELVYLAQKSDVREELDRLDAHIEEVRGTLKSAGAIGRRLDFLMQELNREANTLSSKSVAAEMSISAVELKVIIEQMREQIQNIE